MGKWKFTAPDGSEYIVEGETAEGAYNALNDEIARQVQAEYSSMPWYQQAGTAADDVMRIGGDSLTFGGADHLAGIMPGSEGYDAERFKTQKARIRAGSAQIPIDVLAALGVGRVMPSAVEPVKDMIGGPGLVRAASGGTAAGIETGILGGVDATVRGDDVSEGVGGGVLSGLAGNTISGLFKKGAEGLGFLSKKGTEGYERMRGLTKVDEPAPPPAPKPEAPASPVLAEVPAPAPKPKKKTPAPKPEATASTPSSAAFREAADAADKAEAAAIKAEQVAAGTFSTAKAKAFAQSRATELRKAANTAAQKAQRLADVEATRISAAKKAPTPAAPPKTSTQTPLGTNLTSNRSNVAPGTKPAASSKAKKSAPPPTDARTDTIAALEEARRAADAQARGATGRGFDRALSDDIQRILGNDELMSGLSKEERAAIDAVNRGDPAVRAGRWLGKLPTAQSMLGGAGIGGASVLAGANPMLGLSLAAGIPAGNMLGKHIANAGTRKSLDEAIDKVKGTTPPSNEAMKKMQEDLYNVIRLMGIGQNNSAR